MKIKKINDFLKEENIIDDTPENRERFRTINRRVTEIDAREELKYEIRVLKELEKLFLQFNSKQTYKTTDAQKEIEEKIKDVMASRIEEIKKIIDRL